MKSLPSSPARLRLLTGPAGSGKTHRALEGIRAAATAKHGGGRDALLVLPTYAHVMHLKRVALSRWNVRGILDAPFTTFTAAGERFLPGFRVRALPSREERDRLMEEALRACEEPVFREVADRPGFRARLLRLVKELKQTGLPDASAQGALAEGRASVGQAARERLDAFLGVFAAYERLLDRAGLEDHEDALRRLAVRLREAPFTDPPRLLVVDGFDDFTRVEEHILHGLCRGVIGAGGEVVVTLPWEASRPLLFANSAGTRERLLGEGFVEEPLEGFPRSAAEPLARIARTLFGSDASPIAGGDLVQALVAGDPEDEAETIARTVRRVVRAGEIDGVRSWRDVGIVARRLDDLAPRLEAAFARIGVPLRVVGLGEALAAQPLVRALRGPLEVLGGRVEAGRFVATQILEWLRWRALGMGEAAAAAAVDRWEMDQRARGFAADWAALCDCAPAALAPWLAHLAETAAALAPERGPGAVYRGLQAAVEVLAPLPSPSGFDADGRPLDRVHDRRLARAIAARARLGQILEGLRTAAERTGLGSDVGVAEAVAELSDALEGAAFVLPDRRLDAVSLLDAEEARFWELGLVVVAGLQEGAFPLRPREDILLRDADREALRRHEGALRLPLAREREVRERRLFYGAVTRARARLYLSRHAFDGKGDPQEGSFFLRDLERVVTPSVAVRATAPGRVARPADECFTKVDWRLLAAARLGREVGAPGDAEAETGRALAAALLEVAGSTARARAARHRRRRATALGSAAAAREAVLARFAGTVETLSVSRLNHALVCPHRFFLASVARVPEDDTALDGPAFDYREQGRALHAAFERALRQPQTEAPTIARDAVADAGARGLDARLLEAELVRAVTLLRARQQATAGPLQPWPEGLEWEFSGEGAVPLGSGAGRFRLRGRIDRVDCAGRTATVVDYKRSDGSVESAFKAGRDGIDLQLPLYARALEISSGLTVVGLEWVAGLTRSRRILNDADAQALFDVRREARPLLAEPHAQFRARLEAAEADAAQAVARTRAGDHEKRPHDPAACASCPWAPVCRPDVAWLEEQGAAEVEA